MENDKLNEFAKGIFVKLPNKAAPDFVLLEMSIKPHELFTWAQQFVTEESRGWVNLQIKRSKDGSKIYAQYNSWKPTVSAETVQATKDYNDTKYTDQDRLNVELANKVGLHPTDEDLKAMREIPF